MLWWSSHCWCTNTSRGTKLRCINSICSLGSSKWSTQLIVWESEIVNGCAPQNVTLSDQDGEIIWCRLASTTQWHSNISEQFVILFFFIYGGRQPNDAVPARITVIWALTMYTWLKRVTYLSWLIIYYSKSQVWEREFRNWNNCWGQLWIQEYRPRINKKSIEFKKNAHIHKDSEQQYVAQNATIHVAYSANYPAFIQYT